MVNLGKNITAVTYRPSQTFTPKFTHTRAIPFSQMLFISHLNLHFNEFFPLTAFHQKQFKFPGYGSLAGYRLNTPDTLHTLLTWHVFNNCFKLLHISVCTHKHITNNAAIICRIHTELASQPCGREKHLRIQGQETHVTYTYSKQRLFMQFLLDTIK
jgi:hypothetical protein